MDPTQTKPNRLRSAREEAGLTQQQLADHVGAGRSTIIRAEQGTQRPTLELADRLADALGTTIDDLFSVSGRETLADAYSRGRRDAHDETERTRGVEGDTPPIARAGRVEADTPPTARAGRVEADTPPTARAERVGSDTPPDARAKRVEGDTPPDADPYQEIAAWIAQTVARKPSAPDRATVWHLDNPRRTKRKLDAIVTVTVQRRPRREADRLFKVEAEVDDAQAR
jgi:putative transcriptional regulator